MGLFDMPATSYSDLVKKYNNFMVPAMVMTVDGTDTKKLAGVYISQVRVNLSLEQVCSASFTLENVYDYQNSSLQSEVKKYFQLGSLVTIALGYGSDTTEVFWGYIHELQYSFEEDVSVSVTALDMRRLMMMNQESRTFEEKTYSEIFEEVIGKYSNAFYSKKIEGSTQQIPEVTQQGVSDYDFVTNELCSRDDKEFFVLSGNVYYQTKSRDTSPLLTLTWGENLFSFQLTRSYRDEEISVYGIDEKELVTGEEKVTTEGDINKLSASPFKREIISPNTKDAKGAQAMAKKEAEKEKKKSKYGSGSCIGIPELVPGRYIEIKKLDINGSSLKSILTEVRHSFGRDGYTTEFELGG